MPPNKHARHRPDEPDDNEIFAESVSAEEGALVSRRRVLDPDNAYIKVGLAATILLFAIGGVWGIALSFSSFKSGQDNTRGDVDELRKTQETLKRHTLSPKELDLWAKSMQQQNPTLKVPLPSDYKLEP